LSSHGWPLSTEAFEVQTFFSRSRNAFPAAGRVGGPARRPLLITAFWATDTADDVKKIDGPALILRGDDDPIAAIGAPAMRAPKSSGRN
jgi:pimeloyl-ACP methyl ester carboxylesterase